MATAHAAVPNTKVFGVWVRLNSFEFTLRDARTDATVGSYQIDLTDPTPFTQAMVAMVIAALHSGKVLSVEYLGDGDPRQVTSTTLTT